MTHSGACRLPPSIDMEVIMLEEIADAIQEYKGDPNLVITADTTFSSFGLDSLEEVELIMKIEEKLGVTIDMDGEVQTVGDLVAMCEKAA